MLKAFSLPSLIESPAKIGGGITSLKLTDFRSYKSLRLECDQRPVVLTGRNGMGKTNLLEAISFLSPGKGFRASKLSQAARREGLAQTRSWYVNGDIKQDSETVNMGTGYEFEARRRSEKRLIKINGELLKSQAAMSAYLNVTWLTPQMDGLFQQGSKERRKFLDRLIYTFDPEHASRVYRYEHALRERSKLLKQGIRDPHWLNAVEDIMASSGVAIAYARQEAVNSLSQASDWALGIFPQAHIRLEGDIDEWIAQGLSALAVENRLREALAASRGHDAEQGSAKEGPHRTDMVAIYQEKEMRAEYCSTGEQKALLISLIMASVRVQSTHRAGVPIVLLDEVVAHLDANRRQALYEEISNLRMQVWMTGTEYAMFAQLEDKAQYFSVENSKIKLQDR